MSLSGSCALEQRRVCHLPGPLVCLIGDSVMAKQGCSLEFTGAELYWGPWWAHQPAGWEPSQETSHGSSLVGLGEPALSSLVSYLYLKSLTVYSSLWADVKLVLLSGAGNFPWGCLADLTPLALTSRLFL